MRVRVRGTDLYLSGFKTQKAAEAAATKQRDAILTLGKPAKMGPERTTLAQAMQDFACEALPFLKGARQDANRYNVYLRASGLDTIEVEPIPDAQIGRERNDNQAVSYHVVHLKPHQTTRNVVNSLKNHRCDLQQRRSQSERLRQRLATTKFADVTPYQLQGFVNAMRTDGYTAATIHNEIAQIKRVFNHARRVWRWSSPVFNPAVGLTLPTVDNARDRVLSRAEWKRVCLALDEYGNPYAPAAIALLLETAMRVSEPLLRARWANIDWERRILRLPDSKAGKRDVPLSPMALSVLQLLYERRTDGRILPLSYEALKKAWTTACEKAEVHDVRIHDLRHTAATRLALELHGNRYALKVQTGHKTDSQLDRYVNINADDVVRLLHGEAPGDGSAAGLHDALPLSLMGAARARKSNVATEDNVVQVQFGRRRSA